MPLNQRAIERHCLGTAGRPRCLNSWAPACWGVASLLTLGQTDPIARPISMCASRKRITKTSRKG